MSILEKQVLFHTKRNLENSSEKIKRSMELLNKKTIAKTAK